MLVLKGAESDYFISSVVMAGIGALLACGVVGNFRLPGRLAIACLVAGFGLLNQATAAWVHALGVVWLFGFAGLGFYVIAVPALDEQLETRQVRSQAPGLELRHHVSFVVGLAVLGSTVLALVGGPLLHRPAAMYR